MRIVRFDVVIYVWLGLIFYAIAGTGAADGADAVDDDDAAAAAAAATAAITLSWW